VSILAQAEEHQVEFAHAPQYFGIRARAGNGPALRRDGVPLRRRDRDVIEPGVGGHARIAPRLVRGKAALVAEVDVPRGPIGRRIAQPAVRAERRFAAGEDEVERSALRDRTRGGGADGRCRLAIQGPPIGKRPPAASLLVRGRHCAPP